MNTLAWLEGNYLGNLYYDVAKNAIVRMTKGMSSELRKEGVAAVALTPGFVRTERVMAAHKKHPFDLSSTESASYIGKAVVALSDDSEIRKLSGRVLYVGDSARKYGFKDEGGRQPRRFKASDEPDHPETRSTKRGTEKR